jgi:hypothetical protein
VECFSMGIRYALKPTLQAADQLKVVSCLPSHLPANDCKMVDPIRVHPFPMRRESGLDLVWVRGLPV